MPPGVPGQLGADRPGRSVLREPVPGVWAQQPLGNPLFSKPYLGQKMGLEACIISERGGFWTHFLCGKHAELFTGGAEKAQKCDVFQSVGSEGGSGTSKLESCLQQSA